jgi:predicted RecB family nuclease
MQRLPQGFVYSPQDLIQFINSEFACWMERYTLENPDYDTPDEEPDEMLNALIQLGKEHEQKFLDKLISQGADVCQIENRGAFEATLAAMKAGRAYIYQAALKHESFLGYADFLVRSDLPSKLGDWSYVPLECKLALNPKPDFVLQSCCYSDLLHQIQGDRPQEFRLLLGDGTQQCFPSEQYIYYFYQVRQDFLRTMADFDPDCKPFPGVGDHGRWQTIADQHLLETDHLCQVANITQNQIRRLEGAGIKTMQQLAKVDPSQHIPKLDNAILHRLVSQAQLQKDGAESGQVPYRLVPPDPANLCKGLGLLPPASPLDVYFDMEGYPLVKGGLEYLFGAVFDADGSWLFKDWWAHDATMEKAAFESFIDWVYQRWSDDPSMHVYHYAPYEITALKRLMQRYATREAQVDNLLRAGVFVDLYQIVRQSLMVGTTSYSIKYLEPLYGRTRDESVKTAADSVVQYFHWLQVQDGLSPEASEILRAIRDYNQVDCESTQELTDWLRLLQQDAGIQYQTQTEDDTQTELDTDTEDPVAQLAETLLAQVPAIANPADAKVQELLAHLLQFHSRESKPFWWQRFTWLQMAEAELYDEPDCISGLQCTDTPPYRLTPKSRSWTYDYRFNPDQDLRLSADRECWFAPEEPQKSCSLVALDTQKGTASLSISDKSN